MSLDVYLSTPRPEPTQYGRAVALLREHGFSEVASDIECRYDCSDSDELFSANITHNLNHMAREAGIYEHLWRPDEIGVTRAKQLIEPLRAGLALMRADPARFEKLNPSNGWGSYEVFVPWIARYLCACEDHPEAEIRVSR